MERSFLEISKGIWFSKKDLFTTISENMPHLYPLVELIKWGIKEELYKKVVLSSTIDKLILSKAANFQYPDKDELSISIIYDPLKKDFVISKGKGMQIKTHEKTFHTSEPHKAKEFIDLLNQYL